MERREFPAVQFFVSLVISIFLFIMIFSIANFVSYLNYNAIASGNDEVSKALSDLDVYISTSSCEHTNLIDSSERLDEIGAKINILEKGFGKQDSRVLEQKILYSEIELRHLALINKLNELCGDKFVSIVFFYSNEAEVIDESDNMGYILGIFKDRHPENVMVYSFDYNLDSIIIKSLANKYSISSVPVVVINGNQTLRVSNIDELENTIFDSNKQ